MRSTPHVLLVADPAHPAGEPGAEHLVRALEDEGLTSAWAVWDDPYVDWASAQVVAVRAVHDHRARSADFLGWAEGRVGARLLHGPRAMRWGADAGCLLDLERAGVPVLPTVPVRTAVELRDAVDRFGGRAVVRPRAGSADEPVVVRPRGPLPAVRTHRLVQPVVAEDGGDGTSVLVVGGRPLGSAVRRELGLLAVDAVAAASEQVGAGLVCVRVETVRHGGRPVVRDLDVVSPSLGLDTVPAAAVAFASVVGTLCTP